MTSVTPGPVGDRQLPTSAWVFGLLCLALQVAQLAEQGLNETSGGGVLLSVLLSAAVIWWFSAGVLRARPVRVALVWIVLGLGLLFSALAEAWLDTILSAGLLVALGVYCSTDWYRHQRSQPDAASWEIGGLLLVAVVVGCLGGITAQSTTGGETLQVHVGL